MFSTRKLRAENAKLTERNLELEGWHKGNLTKLFKQSDEITELKSTLQKIIFATNNLRSYLRDSSVELTALVTRNNEVLSKVFKDITTVKFNMVNGPEESKEVLKQIFREETIIDEIISAGLAQHVESQRRMSDLEEG